MKKNIPRSLVFLAFIMLNQSVLFATGYKAWHGCLTAELANQEKALSAATAYVDSLKATYPELLKVLARKLALDEWTKSGAIPLIPGEFFVCAEIRRLALERSITPVKMLEILHREAACVKEHIDTLRSYNNYDFIDRSAVLANLEEIQKNLDALPCESPYFI